MTFSAIASIVVFLAAYVFIIVDKLPRIMIVLIGAALMLLVGATDGGAMFFSEETGIDWNVIFLLLGMMIIVGIMRHTGVFEFLAIWAAKRAKGRPFAVMVMFIVITALLSALLDNVTTVLLIAPVILLVCERLGVSPIPYLISAIMASNIGGTATLIGDPPNIIIASRAGLSFNDFLVHLAPIAIVVLTIFIGVCFLLFRKDFHYDAERAARVMALDEREAITNKGLLIKSLVVVGLVLVGFVTHTITHVEASVIALLGAGLLTLLAGLEPGQYFREVEWETLVFFSGLFIMVGALVHTGVIGQVSELAITAMGDNFGVAAQFLLVGSAVLSGIIDNIPYVATMAPLVGELVTAGGDAAQPLWWALALGADLGGNATAIGASANVVVLGIAKKNGFPISFWGYTKYGLIVTFITILACIPYIWLRYFAF